MCSASLFHKQLRCVFPYFGFAFESLFSGRSALSAGGSGGICFLLLKRSSSIPQTWIIFWTQQVSNPDDLQWVWDHFLASQFVLVDHGLLRDVETEFTSALAVLFFPVSYLHPVYSSTKNSSTLQPPTFSNVVIFLPCFLKASVFFQPSCFLSMIKAMLALLCCSLRCWSWCCFLHPSFLL